MYEYVATVRNVVDGDTLDVEIDVGFYITVRMRIRIMGINCPEVRGETKAAGIAAKQFVEEQLPTGSQILMNTHKIGKYGRYIGTVNCIPTQIDATADEIRAEGIDLADLLVAEGHAEVYRSLDLYLDEEW